MRSSLRLLPGFIDDKAQGALCLSAIEMFSDQVPESAVDVGNGARNGNADELLHFGFAGGGHGCGRPSIDSPVSLDGRSSGVRRWIFVYELVSTMD